MIEQETTSLKSYLFKRRFLFLLLMILAMLMGTPFIGEHFRFRLVVDIVITGVFIVATYAISDKKINIVIALFLVIPIFVDIWDDYLTSGPINLLVYHICGILFLGFAIFHIVNYITKQKHVTLEVIYAAVVVYLLMAILWSDIYQILENFAPGSFAMPDGQIQDDRILFLYFSLVTITTLGYGDMTPLTARAAGLASVEAFTGQIYLVVLVAWLVGMHVSKHSK